MVRNLVVRKFAKPVAATAALLLAASASGDMVRDPTQPVNYAAPAASDASSSQGTLRLSAVFMGDRPYAVISGKAVRAGDELGGYRVESIGNGSVVLRNGGESVTLKLHSARVIRN